MKKNTYICKKLFMTCTETLYIESATSLQDKLVKLDQIIDGLIDQQIAAVGNSDIDEYMVDDGQVKIKTIYRSADAIAKAIVGYERVKQTILNKLNGRVMVFRPATGMS